MIYFPPTHSLFREQSIILQDYFVFFEVVYIVYGVLFLYTKKQMYSINVSIHITLFKYHLFLLINGINSTCQIFLKGAQIWKRPSSIIQTRVGQKDFLILPLIYPYFLTIRLLTYLGELDIRVKNHYTTQLYSLCLRVHLPNYTILHFSGLSFQFIKMFKISSMLASFTNVNLHYSH